MTRRTILATAAAAALPAQTRSARPNLLFLVADTWRGQVVPSENDSGVIAPNLTRLAKEGVSCRRTYCSYPVCCPSRAAMLTGKFPHAAGVTRNHTRLPLSEETLSAVLKRDGYRTGYIGKWHLDGGENPGFVPPERRRGFDYWAAFNVAHRHYDSVYFRDSPEPISMAGFEPDAETDLALDFIRQRDDRPFFLYLSWVAPHAPFTPPAKFASKYDPSKIPLRTNVPDRGETEVRKDLAGYLGLCTAVDENVGRLLDELDRRALAQDTIVVFTSDHGHMLGSQGLDAIDLPFEESSRIPLLVRYPRRFKGGTVIDSLVSNVDYAPTLLRLCGSAVPKGMQGVDLSNLLAGGKGESSESIYAEGSLGQPQEWRMIVRGFDKLVVDAAMKPTHLYNLGQDPFELTNLITEGSERRRLDELTALLKRWAFRTGDRIGTQ